jgi:hypothetical protein
MPWFRFGVFVRRFCSISLSCLGHRLTLLCTIVEQRLELVLIVFCY